MMDYATFKAVAEKKILDYFPDSFKNATVEIKPITKVNKTKDAITIFADDDMKITPNFYLDDMYEHYKNFEDLEEVFSKVAASYVRELEAAKDFRLPVFSKEFVSENVFMTMVNTESNKELLMNAVHRDINDCSVIYRIMVDNSERGLASIMVTNDIAETAELSEQELFLAASENTKRILPAKIMNMKEVIMGTMTKDGMPREVAESLIGSQEEMELPMWVITNESGINGAVNMLYDENLQMLSQKLNDDLYILPSSIHEVICIPASMGEPEQLAEMVNEVNMACVCLEDRLSNQVYHYDKDLRKLTMATDTPNKGIGDMVAEQSLIYEAKEQKR
ncbi:MAG: hypothetical protein E7294_08400 [Lachnospiraceae bacterium]|nr:hypothetical protein [Lachnospiraceae bacterium]